MTGEALRAVGADEALRAVDPLNTSGRLENPNQAQQGQPGGDNMAEIDRTKRGL